MNQMQCNKNYQSISAIVNEAMVSNIQDQFQNKRIIIPSKNQAIKNSLEKKLKKNHDQIGKLNNFKEALKIKKKIKIIKKYIQFIKKQTTSTFQKIKTTNQGINTQQEILTHVLEDQNDIQNNTLDKNKNPLSYSLQVQQLLQSVLQNQKDHLYSQYISKSQKWNEIYKSFEKNISSLSSQISSLEKHNIWGKTFHYFNAIAIPAISIGANFAIGGGAILTTTLQKLSSMGLSAIGNSTLKGIQAQKIQSIQENIKTNQVLENNTHKNLSSLLRNLQNEDIKQKQQYSSHQKVKDEILNLLQ